MNLLEETGHGTGFRPDDGPWFRPGRRLAGIRAGQMKPPRGRVLAAVKQWHGLTYEQEYEHLQQYQE